MRWVELEKPLKKQMDKFASEPLLFFGVMFYVPSVIRLQQEVTRYLITHFVLKNTDILQYEATVLDPVDISSDPKGGWLLPISPLLQ